MNILALDYGTKTGFAYGDIKQNHCTSFGTWTLAKPKEITIWGKDRLTRQCDPRISRLAGHLRAFPLTNFIVFEDVQFASSTYQVQLWASLRAAGWLSFPHGFGWECVPVGALKKFATGSGSADKGQMESALRQKIVLPALTDDNAIDAIWIWRWAKENLSRRA